MNHPRNLYQNSNDAEVLVPIRLDFEASGIKIRDQFTWNLNGALD